KIVPKPAQIVRCRANGTVGSRAESAIAARGDIQKRYPNHLSLTVQSHGVTSDARSETADVENRVTLLPESGQSQTFDQKNQQQHGQTPGRPSEGILHDPKFLPVS